MKVFVINVDKDNRRMESLHKHLVEQELEYERVSAETGPNDEDFNELLKNTCPKGVLGLSASHRKIWKQIIEEELDMAMILEDDARFTKDAPKILNKVLEQLPSDFDILYLGCGGVCDDQPLKSPSDLIYAVLYSAPRSSKTISKNLIVPKFPTETHAYIVSNKGARALLAEQKVCHIDADISTTPNLKMYACNPVIAVQDRDNFGSHNTVKFPKVLQSVVGGNYGLEILGFSLFDTLPINLWTAILGILIAFFPWFAIVLIPDIYDSMNMVVSTLFISAIVRSIIS